MPERQLQIQSPVGLWPPNWPMGLTMLRLLLLPVFLWLLLQGAGAAAGEHRSRGFRWTAIGVFGVMAATDKLDGYLARKLNQSSKIGAILDPIADKLLVAYSVILLSFPMIAQANFAIPKIVVIAIYGKDVIVAVGTLALLYAAGKVTITPRPFGKASTFLQLGLVLATLLGPDLGRSAGPILLVLWWVVPIVAAASCADYLALGVRQFRQRN